jgi:tetratricopeptide (TPR) repeat protein
MRHLLRLSLAAAIAAATTQAHAAWYEAKSKHFIIDGDVDPQDLTDYARKLERFDQAVRIARGMQDPSLTDAGRLRIYFLRNADEWRDLTDDDGTLGEYKSSAAGSFAFVQKMKGDRAGDFNSDLLFFHEYAHHMMFESWAAALPTWVSEGFAEFFSTAKINDDGTVVLGAAANQRSIGVYALHHAYPLSDMLSDSRDWLTGWQIELIYSRGWLLTHYLTFEPTRRGQLNKYVEAIQSGQSARDAARAAFGDIGKLDGELDHYADQKNLPGVVIQTDSAKLGPITVQDLPPGTAALIPVQMRSDYGVTPANERFVAGKARGLAADYPSDPFAQAALAQAEYGAAYYSAAEAAADQALAVDPNNVHALIYKGKAEMELAEETPSTADWSKIRSWFAKANHVDTENAEPLMLYYRSFVAAGQSPTPSAVKGLMYALVLAPQDQRLRWMAVRQLLVDGKLAEARRTMAPIAYDPHGGIARAKARDVLSAIEGDGPMKAVAMIDAVEREWKQE